MINFLGVESNFSVLAGMRWESTFRFVDGESGEVANLDGLTFAGAAVVGEGEEERVVEFELTRYELDEKRNEVLASVPPLPEGRWPMAIYATSDSGARSRLISGYVTAVGELKEESAKVYANRTLEVRLPGDANRRIQVEWQASSLAQRTLEETREVRNEVRDMRDEVEEMKKKAEEAYGSLDGLKESVEEARDFVANAIEGTIPWIGENGNWWRGSGENAYDLNVRAVGRDGRDGLNGADGHDGADGRDGEDGKDGEPGKSPQIRYVDIEVDGERYTGFYWFNWDAAVGDYVFSPVRAEAKDGLDGLDADAFRSLFVQSREALPEVGDKNTIYYVPQYNAQGEIELYHMWRWLEHADGGYAWHNMFDTPTIDYFAQKGLENVQILASDYSKAYPETYLPKISWVMQAIATVVAAAKAEIVRLASVSTMGMVKLGTNNRYEDGGWLALNEAGQGVIAPASTTRYGAVKTSTSIALTAANGGLIGMSADGQLMTYRAGYQRFGGVALGTNFEIVCNEAPYCIPIPVANGDTTYNSQAGNMAGAIILNLARKGCLKYNAGGPNGENNGNSIWLDYDSNSLALEDGKLNATPWVTNVVVEENPKPVSSAGVIKYVNAQIEEKLRDYVTNDKLKERLEGYVQSETLNKTLEGYVQSETLNKTLEGYVTSGSQKTTLDGYVKTADLDNTLKEYVKGEGGVKTLSYMTLEEYNKLSTKTTGTLYILK